MPRQNHPQRAAASGLRLALPALVGAAANSDRWRGGRADGGCKVSRHSLLLPRLLSPRRDAGADGYGRRLARIRARLLLRQLPSRPINPCGLTSSGAVFRADLADNAASPLLPDGTVILAYNPKTGDASVLRITNAGPYSGDRKLDVSRAAAEKLGFRNQGVAALVISVLQSPTSAEASYVRERVYPRVPGYVGRFATFDNALESAKVALNVGEDGQRSAGDAGVAAGTPAGEWFRPDAAARSLAIARPRAGDATLRPATGEPGGAACAGSASREPSRLHDPAFSCADQRNNRLRVGPAEVSTSGERAGKRPLVEAV